MCIWRVTRRMLAEAERPTPLNSTIKGLLALDAETQTKFFAMEHVFWIKVRHQHCDISLLPPNPFYSEVSYHHS